MKRCPCCKRVHTREEFDALPLVGMGGKLFHTGGAVLAMRNCVCGSTIAIDVTDEFNRGEFTR